jgi:hypothetical protein
MKNFWNLFLILFFISIIFVLVDWNVDGFNFFQFQEQHFYFQSWISIAGILFSAIMAITTFTIYKTSKIPSLRYIPISFLLTSIAYAIIGYHASYCEVCSDLGYCAASHSYSIYLMIIVFVIFVLTIIMFSRRLDIVKKAQLLQKFSYGLIIATILLGITLFISLKYLEIHDHIAYLSTTNLQAFIFLLPLIIILLAFVYFRGTYQASRTYILMAVLASLSFIPQFLHIYRCKDCHVMECSEFYVLSGIIMVIVTGLLIHSVAIQLLENRK